ncbi:MAG: hypothetical protein QM651_07625 [Rhodoblastus sp.]
MSKRMFELQTILLQAIANRSDAPEIRACIYREIGLAAVAGEFGFNLSDFEPAAPPSQGRKDAYIEGQEIAA